MTCGTVLNPSSLLVENKEKYKKLTKIFFRFLNALNRSQIHVQMNCFHLLQSHSHAQSKKKTVASTVYVARRKVSRHSSKRAGGTQSNDCDCRTDSSITWRSLQRVLESVKKKRKMFCARPV